MRVILLGNGAIELAAFLASQGEVTFASTEPLDSIRTELKASDKLISYNYRHIIREPWLSYFSWKPINLHISLLPWNRGAEPNLWSFLEDTPKGVTIHEIESGLDTGTILLQKSVEFSPDETLKSSYDKLQTEIRELFKNNWEFLKLKRTSRTNQMGEGTSHRTKDSEPYRALLRLGWDTPVSELVGKAKTGDRK